MSGCASGSRLIGRVMVIVVLLLALVPVTKQAWATDEYYVDIESGDDSSNNGKTLSGAFKTIHKAVDTFLGNANPAIIHVVAGSTEYSKANGEDDSAITILSGYQGLTIKGYNGGRPVINGTGASSWITGFTVQGSTEVTFSSLEIKNFAGFGIDLQGDHSTIDDCWINNNTDPGVKIQGDGNKISNSYVYENSAEGIHITGSSNTVSGCEVYHNSGTAGVAGIYVATSSGNSSNIITDNKVYDNGGAANSAAGIKDEADYTTISQNIVSSAGNASHLQEGGILAKGGNTNVCGNTVNGHTGTDYYGISCSGSGLTVSRNKVYLNRRGIHITGLYALIAPTITRNEVYENHDYGIFGEGSSNGISPSIVNNLVYKNVTSNINIKDDLMASAPSIMHNTIDGVAGSLGISLNMSTGSLPVIKYNIVTNHDTGILVASFGGAPETVALDYNDVWNNTTANYNLVAPHNPGANDISEDPLYGSYTLQEASPCIDVIPDSAGDNVTIDFDGNTRPQGIGGDMGCYETGSYQPKLTVATYPDDGGGVVSTPEGIDCPDEACKEFFDPDDTVTLTATPAAGNRFDHWEKGLTGVNNPGSLVMGEEDVTVIAVFTPESHTRNIPAGTEAGDYVLYSVPMSPDDTSPEGFFGLDADNYDTNQHRIGRWSPTAGAYKEFPWVGSVLPGRAYWLLMADGMDLTASGQSPELVDDPLHGLPSCKVQVYKGWNMIGNPFQYPISLSNAVASFGGTNKELLSATDYYVWNGTAYQTATSLGISEGGWVKASADGYVYFQAVVHETSADIPDTRADVAADSDLPPNPPGVEDTTDTSSGGGGGGCFIQAIRPADRGKK